MDFIVLKRVMSAVKELPTLPSVVQRVNQLINDSKTDTADLARVIASDQSLAVKVLRAVNSAYYGPQKTNSVQRAVTVLGFRTVSQLVTNVSICKMFQDSPGGAFDRSEFWRHSIAVAALSRSIAAQTKQAQPDDAFTCGLLHDIGKIILDQYLHPEMVRVLAHTAEKKVEFFQAEKEVLGIDHTTIGEMAAKTWRLPLSVLVTIKHHHSELEDRKGLPFSDDGVVDVVRLADFFAREMKIGNSGDGAPPVWSDKIAGRVAIPAEALRRIREGCLADVERAAAALDLPIKHAAEAS